MRSSSDVLLDSSRKFITSQRHKKDDPKASIGSSVVEAPEEYEDLLRQYEGNIRSHIQCEQQLQLHLEILTEKMEQAQQEHTTKVEHLGTQVKQANKKYLEQKIKADALEQEVEEIQKKQAKETEKLQRELNKYEALRKEKDKEMDKLKNLLREKSLAIESLQSANKNKDI